VITEGKGAADNLIGILIRRLDPKLRGAAVSVAIADDQARMLPDSQGSPTFQAIRLDGYATVAEYAQAFGKASGRNVQRLAPMMTQENLDGVLWVRRDYRIFAVPELTRWSRYWWYGVIETEAQLFDKEGKQILKVAWLNHGDMARLGRRPSGNKPRRRCPRRAMQPTRTWPRCWRSRPPAERCPSSVLQPPRSRTNGCWMWRSLCAARCSCMCS